MGHHGKHLSHSASSAFPKVTESVWVHRDLLSVQVHCSFFSLKSIYQQVVFLVTRQSVYLNTFVSLRSSEKGLQGVMSGKPVQMRSARLIRWSCGLRTLLLVSLCLFSPLLKEIESDGAGTFEGSRDINDIVNFVPSFLIKSRYLLQTVALGSEEEVRWMLSDSQCNPSSPNTLKDLKVFSLFSLLSLWFLLPFLTSSTWGKF